MAALAFGSRGPSPRARGAPRPAIYEWVQLGTIPACAGSTETANTAAGMRADHPRVRGEHAPGGWRRRGGWGPSPRARGALPLGADVPHVLGTIPACAGSTPGRAASQTCRRDHPRVRGEHNRPGTGPAPGRGPSPRARGAPLFSEADKNVVGTIPACAGSTASPVPAPSGPRDHPRVRGEHVTALLRARTRAGPSPRARGAHSLTWEFRLRTGCFRALSQKRTYRQTDELSADPEHDNCHGGGDKGGWWLAWP